MRLVDNLREAEKKGAMTIRRGVERAREEWADVERRIRQRMRIYPQKEKTMAMAAARGAPAAPDLNLTSDANDSDRTDERKPIISIHGRDVKN